METPPTSTHYKMPLVAMTALIIAFFAGAVGVDYFTNESKEKSESLTIGHIALLKNDTRHKSMGSVVWTKADKDRAIFLGDAIFSGSNSFTTINLKSGARVNIGENSLVVFDKSIGQNTPNLNLIQGNFLVTVKENTTLAVRGKVIKLQGNDSRVQFYVDKNLVAKIKPIDGETQVSYGSHKSYEPLPANEALIVPNDTSVVAKITDLNLPIDAQQILAANDPFIDEPIRHIAQEAPEEAPQEETPQIVETSAEEIISEPPPVAQTTSTNPASVVKAPTPSKIEKREESQLEEIPSAPEEPEPSIAKDGHKKFWLWLGTGLHYNAISQSSSDYADIEKSDLNGTSFFAIARGGFYLGRNWGLDLAYRYSPAKLKANASVSSTSYNWQSASADILYRFAPKEDAKSEWNVRLGAQQHQLPFIVANPDSSIAVQNSSLLNASLGFGYSRKLNERLKLEWILKYQHALSTSASGGGKFSIKPGFGLDNTLGLTYYLSGSTYLGLYWYTQYQNFDFEYTHSGTNDFTGKQKFIFSNADARIGLEF